MKPHNDNVVPFEQKARPEPATTKRDSVVDKLMVTVTMDDAVAAAMRNRRAYAGTPQLLICSCQSGRLQPRIEMVPIIHFNADGGFIAGLNCALCNRTIPVTNGYPAMAKEDLTPPTPPGAS